MKNILRIIFAINFLFLWSCTDIWDTHFNAVPETSDQDIWEVLQNDKDVSMFVEALKQFHYDSIFKSVRIHTYFIPTNQAITEFLTGNKITKTVLDYHIIVGFIQSQSVSSQQRIQTLALKLAQFSRAGNNIFFDGIAIHYESPLYKNGKYYKMNKVAIPKPNLYEFYVLNNPILKAYIDSKDSVVLDKERSKPIGFDKNGNTIYDTVAVTINNFEVKYFPVKQELRNFTATIVFPQKEKYESALNVMAQKLGGSYQSYKDIPTNWQNDILIPKLLEKGVFLNELEQSEFLKPPKKDTLKLLNILGDSVVVDYWPVNKKFCSNGIAYDYETFVIPDSLYSGKTRTEGEQLVREVGTNKFTWRDSVKITSDQSFTPLRQYIPGASKDSILNVTFTKGYNKKFIVEFKAPNLFPRKYRAVVRTHMDIGGIYDIYINNKLVKTFNYYDYITYKGVLPSVQSGVRFIAEGRFNRFDFWVDNLTNYGRATVRFEYKGPSTYLPSNGFILDYMEFIPQ
jgi:hypothetical protein